MVYVAVSKLGCSDLVFTEPAAKVNESYYREEFASTHLAHCWRHLCFPAKQCTAHHDRETVVFLARQTPQYTVLWPPNSPDLNPVDYKVWGVMQERVYQKPIHALDDLKRRRLIAAWSSMQQEVIDEVIDQWRKRLCACVNAHGGHFEYLL